MDGPFQWSTQKATQHITLTCYNASLSSPTEQEEEMSCWEGAEGVSTRPQRNQLEYELGSDFMCDEGQAAEFPGPKFRSLRHLRHVSKHNSSDLKIACCCGFADAAAGV